MNWDDLRFFLALARTGKLIGAGAVLNVDHTTVRRRIMTLEETLGETLFARSPKGYALTDAGERLVSHAEDVESRMLIAQSDFEKGGAHLTGVVRIGAPEGLGAYVVADAASDLCDAHPQLEVQLTAAPRVMRLADREVDIAFSVSRPTSGRLKARKVADYKLHLYASEGFLRRHPPITRMDDLTELRGIGYIQQQLYDEELNFQLQTSSDLKPHLTSTSINVQIRVAVAGRGVCILPDFMAAQHPELQRILPDDIDFVRSTWMVTHEDMGRLEKVRQCADFLAERVRRGVTVAK
ncbi:MAG: LysR family transcriptional regulator [Paracoccaceae bacterium]|jgi:DNA-binding transcriptional LysR family regulator|nr:LysR family transcriptional regulator [Paracoccaceae bacterium]MDG1373546.1 LysR family transcriptional regulator [Paracoccaceae bacterium]MDG1971069.1 LysR family transcriptional regulator [Paracoccaceae bacterium]